jgi:hypothetical protein
MNILYIQAIVKYQIVTGMVPALIHKISEFCQTRRLKWFGAYYLAEPVVLALLVPGVNLEDLPAKLDILGGGLTLLHPSQDVPKT